MGGGGGIQTNLNIIFAYIQCRIDIVNTVVQFYAVNASSLLFYIRKYVLNKAEFVLWAAFATFGINICTAPELAVHPLFLVSLFFISFSIYSFFFVSIFLHIAYSARLFILYG